MTNKEAIEELQDQMNGEIAEFGEENIGYTIKAYEMAIEALQERKTAQDATEAAEKPEFEEGELIVYQNGETFAIGEIKRMCEEGAFVYYHEGDTASLTPFENMHKLQNAYCIKQTSFALDRNAEE